MDLAGICWMSARATFGHRKGLPMRSAGFPCRMVGCDRAFQVTDQTSMAALKAASAARVAHEIADHDYRHIPLAESPAPTPYMRSKSKGVSAPKA